MIDLTIPKGAIFSPDGKYRYALWRVWKAEPKLRLCIGLNPSTAGAISDDPTITRGITRAYQDGFGGLLWANLYSYVSTNPKALLKEKDTAGPDTDNYLKELIAMSSQVVCGWGSFAPVSKRAPDVLRMIPEPYCLGVNADGQPKHPLYVSYQTPVVKYETLMNDRGSSIK